MNCPNFGRQIRREFFAYCPQFSDYFDFLEVFLTEEELFELLLQTLNELVLLLADLSAAALITVALLKEVLLEASLLEADFTAFIAESWLMAAAQS